jgi:hypothetical protein
MRKKYEPQVSLDYLPQIPPNVLSRKYDAIAAILEKTPEVFDGVYRDLTAGVKNPFTGRQAMDAEQVLRCAIFKAIEDCSYRDLVAHVADSVRSGGGKAGGPSRVTYGRRL